MGFYSIYKIIKDIIRTLFGKTFLKIFLVIAIVFTIVFIYSEKTFASSASYNYTYNNTTKIFTIDSELMNYTYIFSCVCANPGYSNNGQVSFIASDTQPTISATTGAYASLYITFPAGATVRSWGYSGNIASYISNGVNLTNDMVNTYNSNSPRNLVIPYWDNSYHFGYYDMNTISYLSTFDVIANGTTYFNSNYSTYIAPSLGNTQSQLENLSFDNFIINANSFTQDMINDPDAPLVMLFYNRSLSNNSNTDGLYPIKEKYFYKESIYFDSENSTDDNYIFNYPIFRSGVFFNIGSTYEIKLAKRVYIEEYNTWGYDYFDNSYVFTVSSNVTQDYINQLNQQTATSTDEDNQQQQLNALNNQTQAIENQTQSIDNINNSITDSAVDNSSINLPTDNTNDPTQNGVDNIFQTIYNSFTSGTAQDIVFPIPFSNNNLVIQANYVLNMLGSTQAGSVIISLIQAYYWYLISRFIITDIMRKIRKIKQGNFENLQNSNIKEDML